MENVAQRYVSSFESGNEFRSADSVARLIVGNQIDPLALRILRMNLSRGTPFVRENIVRLLEKLGMQLNASAPLSIRVIRDKAVIKALAIEGFAQDDPAADLAAKCLLDRVTPGDLATLNNAFMESIAQGKGDYLYLAAKAKTREALPLLERLAAQDSWRSSPDRMQKLNIARAALGNTAIEDEFIASTT